MPDGGFWMAEKEGVWVITNKVFFEPSKNMVFWQVLKRV
jgi:hypothetical protein